MAHGHDFKAKSHAHNACKITYSGTNAAIIKCKLASAARWPKWAMYSGITERRWYQACTLTRDTFTTRPPAPQARTAPPTPLVLRFSHGVAVICA